MNTAFEFIRSFEPAPPAGDAEQRVLLLRQLGIFDSDPEPSFDGLAVAAAALTDCPIALLRLLDANRQWFKARHGLTVAETPLAWSLCAHAVLQDGLFEVEDTHADPRFAGNPMVIGELGIRFYAGQPLLLDGVPLGTLCVIDTKPRTLTPTVRAALQGLAQTATALLAARQARAALEEQQRRLADVAIASGDWLWEADTQGRLQRCVGDDDEAVVGHPLRTGALLPDGPLLDLRGDPVEPPVSLGSMLARPGKIKRAMLSAPTPDGPMFLSFSAVRSFGADGQWLGHRGTARDLSGAVAHERQHYEADVALRLERDAARQSARLRSELVSRVSHELRTPLNAVLGFSQLLQREPHEAVRYGAHIQRAGAHLLSLVNDMLDLARLEAGHADVDLRPVSAANVIQRCLDLLAPEAHSRGVHLEVITDPAVSAVMANVRGLTQALLNLGNNAIKFSPAGSTVRVATRLLEDGRVEISVADQGQGIPAEQFARLFQPFNRLPGAASAAGTGLGLAITRQLVQAMDGDVTVSSVPGQGAVFSMTLRSAEQEEGAGTDSGFASLRPPGTSTAAAGLQVLYVEDDAVSAMLMEHMLAHLGQRQMHHAATALEGIQKARQHRLDVILMDMNLPDGHGLEVLATLRADPRTASVPVVALSADALPEAIDHARAAGFDDYLTKPVNLTELVHLLDSLRREA